MGEEPSELEIKKWADAPPAVRSELVELLRAGQTLAAIKLLREHRNIGVHEAHMAIHRLRDAINFAPCPNCGKQVRTPKAKQCFGCGADWH